MVRSNVTRFKNVGISDSVTCKLRFQVVAVLTSTAGAITDLRMVGNSLFDPEIAVSTGQPYWFDQYAGMYDFYEVLASSIKVSAWNQNIDNSRLLVGALTVVPMVQLTAIGATAHQELNGYAYRKQKVFQQSTKPAFIKHYIGSYKVYGRTNQKGINSAFQASTGSDPVDSWAWHVCYNTVDQANNSTVLVKIDMTYYARFFQRRIVAAS